MAYDHSRLPSLVENQKRAQYYREKEFRELAEQNRILQSQLLQEKRQKQFGGAGILGQPPEARGQQYLLNDPYEQQQQQQQAPSILGRYSTPHADPYASRAASSYHLQEIEREHAAAAWEREQELEERKREQEYREREMAMLRRRQLQQQQQQQQQQQHMREVAEQRRYSGEYGHAPVAGHYAFAAEKRIVVKKDNPRDNIPSLFSMNMRGEGRRTALQRLGGRAEPYPSKRTPYSKPTASQSKYANNNKKTDEQQQRRVINDKKITITIGPSVAGKESRKNQVKSPAAAAGAGAKMDPNSGKSSGGNKSGEVYDPAEPTEDDLPAQNTKPAAEKRPIKRVRSPNEPSSPSTEPPAKKKLNEEEQKFQCQLCAVNCNNHLNYENHMNGNKHKKKVEETSEITKFKSQQAQARLQAEEHLKQMGSPPQKNKKQANKVVKTTATTAVTAAAAPAASAKPTTPPVAPATKETSSNQAVAVAPTDKSTAGNKTTSKIAATPAGRTPAQPASSTASFKAPHSGSAEPPRPPLKPAATATKIVASLKKVLGPKQPPAEEGQKPAPSANSGSSGKDPAAGPLPPAASTPKETDEDVPFDPDVPYNKDVAVGQDLVIAVQGYFCKICRRFYSDKVLAKVTHCKSEPHYAALKKDYFLKKQKGKKTAKNATDPKGKVAPAQSATSTTVKPSEEKKESPAPPAPREVAGEKTDIKSASEVIEPKKIEENIKNAENQEDNQEDNQEEENQAENQEENQEENKEENQAENTMVVDEYINENDDESETEEAKVEDKKVKKKERIRDSYTKDQDEDSDEESDDEVNKNADDDDESEDEVIKMDSEEVNKEDPVEGSEDEKDLDKSGGEGVNEGEEPAEIDIMAREDDNESLINELQSFEEHSEGPGSSKKVKTTASVTAPAPAPALVLAPSPATTFVTPTPKKTSTPSRGGGRGRGNKNRGGNRGAHNRGANNRGAGNRGAGNRGAGNRRANRGVNRGGRGAVNYGRDVGVGYVRGGGQFRGQGLFRGLQTRGRGGRRY